MSLLTLLKMPAKYVLDPHYYIVLESHLHYLRTHPLTRVVYVTGQQAEKFTGDFDGLLDSLSIDKKYHYLITRLNNLACSTDYEGLETSIVMPDSNTISRFITIYTSLED